MDPKKSKEIIDLNIKVAGKKMPPDTLEALQQASLALERHIQRHHLTFSEMMEPLIGETVEPDSP